jgi:hypothetical protein
MITRKCKPRANQNSDAIVDSNLLATEIKMIVREGGSWAQKLSCVPLLLHINHLKQHQIENKSLPLPRIPEL